MFTDMVGYTALTQSSESQAMGVLERHNRLMKPFFPRFHGREVKTMGDAFLVEFDSALDAVSCAIEMQRFLHDYNVSSRDDWKITLRIGIHIGDVVHSGSDIFGDAVNIASRLQPLSEPEGVCISDQVYGQVRNKIPQTLEKLAPQDLKGVRFPVDVYKVVMPWEEAKGPEKVPRLDTKRVAVLPFASMSPDKNDEFFADGLTEELIDRLAQVRELGVIARTSVMNYKGERKNASQIGSELKVGALVEGSIRKAGSRIRVTAQLIDANTEEHLWSSRYDRDLEDIFAVQTDIAEKVAAELKVHLVDSERHALEKKPTESTEAYADFLQGMQLVYKIEEVAIRQALSFFERAIERDAKFARAYAGLALCYNRLGMGGFVPWQEATKKGRATAMKSLELDPDLPEAHLRLAENMSMSDDFPGERMEVRRTLELNPNLAEAYVQQADVATIEDDLPGVVRAYEKAYQLDPLSRAVAVLGSAYFWAGRDREALDQWKKALPLEPIRTNRRLFDYYASKNDLQEAERVVQELERMAPRVTGTYLNRGYLAAITGDTKTAREMIEKLEPTEGASHVAGFIYLALGDLDRFFEYMFRSVDDHTLPVADLRYNPLLEKARDDPRFAEIFRRVGLPYESRNRTRSL